MNSTYFGLLAEFEAAEIPLEKMCAKYLGLCERKAKEKARLGTLPVKAYRLPKCRSWLVSASDLAEVIDGVKSK